MNKFIMLKDAYNNWISGVGIFQNMDPSKLTWITELGALTLDIDFFTSYGERYCSPKVQYFLNESDNISEQNAKTLALYLENKYAVNWARKYELLKLSYDPIQNYNRTETETVSNKQTDTETIDNSTTITNKSDTTQTNDLANTVNVEQDSSANSDNSVFGFNSESAVNDNKNVTSGSGTTNQTEKDTGTINSTQNNNGSNVVKGSKDNTHDETITRNLTNVGNIGVTTNQQMIASEIELWKWNFYEDVFNDILKELTLAIY